MNCVQWTIQTLKPQPQPQYQYPDLKMGGYTRRREFDMIYRKKCYYDARFCFSLTTPTFSPRFYHSASLSASLTRQCEQRAEIDLEVCRSRSIFV